MRIHQTCFKKKSPFCFLSGIVGSRNSDFLFMPGSGGLAGPGCAFIANFWKDISMLNISESNTPYGHLGNKVATHSYYGMHESPYILMVKKSSQCSIYYIASVVFSRINNLYNSEPSCLNKIVIQFQTCFNSPLYLIQFL